MVHGKFLRNTAVAVFVFGILSLPIHSVSGASLTAATIQNGINTERVKAHVPELKVSSKLQKGAQLKAQDMAKNNYFNHTSPHGKTPWYWFKTAGYSYSYAGENLAIQYSNTNELVGSWMRSKTHKANILNKNFTETGIGIAQKTVGGKQVTYIVQLFGKPKYATNLSPLKKPLKKPASANSSSRILFLSEQYRVSFKGDS